MAYRYNSHYCEILTAIIRYAISIYQHENRTLNVAQCSSLKYHFSSLLCFMTQTLCSVLDFNFNSCHAVWSICIKKCTVCNNE